MKHSREEKSGFAPINGAHLYYKSSGIGELVLFLHAGVADCRMWDEQFPALSSRYQVVGCDLRGFGQSALPKSSYAHYEDIAALLTFLGADRVHLVAASFGGAVALDFAIAYPEKVRTLVLAASAVGGYKFTSPEMRRFVEIEDTALDSGDIEAATEANLAMWVQAGRPRGAQPTQAVRDKVYQMQLQIFSNSDDEEPEEKELDPPAIKRLHEIEAPALVLIGDQDVTEFQHLSHRLAGEIPGATINVVGDVAHLISMEKPQVFNEAVLSFLRLHPN